MFDNNRYLTCGVDATIPMELQLFMWACVDQLPQERDYLQVFELKTVDGKQFISHNSEQPEYHKEFIIPSESPITEKINIIDDCNHSTMLLASEY